ACDSRLIADFFKDAVIVMVEPVLSVIGNVQIVPAVILVIADADALAPPGRLQASVHCDVNKRAVVIITIEVIGGRSCTRYAFERGDVHDENIWPAVIVVIENCNPGAGRLDNVLLGIYAAEDGGHGESSFFGYVLEICNPRRLCSY